MTRLTWGLPGSRTYELGVDRGVLYRLNSTGVAWVGLTAVSESPSNAELKTYYVDGLKYLSFFGSMEFEATIEALSSPAEFDSCDGMAALYSGLYATQQPRDTFNFSYRTLSGSDTEELGSVYKVHLVYNALAAPSEKSYTTIGDSPEPVSLSWDVSTTPIAVAGYQPTSHLVIDSRRTPALVLSELEDILYGTLGTAPRMPEPSEVASLFA